MYLTPPRQLADELASESVGVIINPPRSYPGSWDTQRTLAGPPLTQHTLASFLTSKGVLVGLGHKSGAEARNARFDALWNARSVEGLGYKEALGFVSSNLLRLLGVEERQRGLIAVEGDAFGLGSRVVGVVDNGVVELF